jgi:hypothetical protein
MAQSRNLHPARERRRTSNDLTASKNLDKLAVRLRYHCHLYVHAWRGKPSTRKSQGESRLRNPKKRPTLKRREEPRRKLFEVLAWLSLVGIASAPALHAQSNTRLLLAAGAGVPEHPGFVFGPFSFLSMNENRDIVFLSTLSSTRSEIRAVVRSTGVTFTVPAFQGLRSPVPRTTYDSFSPPSINDAGVIAFTAGLKDSGESPTSAVIRMEPSGARAVVTSMDSAPGIPDALFQEFSAPLITSQGNIVFGARWGGTKPGSGLFLWTPQGLRPLEMPPGMSVAPRKLFVPIFFSHDEAIFLLHGIPTEAGIDQFFRAVASRSLQELKPPPDPKDTTQILASHAGEKPVQMLLVLMEGENVQTALLPGDPMQAVLSKQIPGAGPIKPLGRIEAETTTGQGNIIMAATPADAANDLGLYCYCDDQLIRLTTPEDFSAITQAAPGKPLLSLAGDSQKTVVFIAPGPTGDGSAIYVTSIP